MIPKGTMCKTSDKICANRVADEVDLGARSSDITLEATTTLRPLVASAFRLSSAIETLLTSGGTHVGIFT